MRTDLSATTPLAVKRLLLFGLDAGIGALAFWLALFSRFGDAAHMSWRQSVVATLLVALMFPTVALLCGVHRVVTRFATSQLGLRAAVAAGIAGLLLTLLAVQGGASGRMALGQGVVFALFLVTLVVASRLVARAVLNPGGATGAMGVPVAIYGAGAAGRQLVASLRLSRAYRPVLFIDDAKSLSGRLVEDLSVVSGSDESLAAKLAARGVREILLAIPSLRAERRREILRKLEPLAFHVRSVPALEGILYGGERLDRLVEIPIGDLLGRPSVAPIDGLLEKCVTGRAVLVTGAGGSIGSELCRQIVKLKPRTLLLLDHAEFSLYAIEMELRRALEANPAGTAPRIVAVLGSVLDEGLVDTLLQDHSIETVYHAAAYKHVPMVEHNPSQGIRNNVFGTKVVAEATARHAVAHFVLISTDKAVRPTNVMGASKRLAEMVVRSVATRSTRTVFSMVRFGNVLGSSGSVVPLFKQQIADGGPVTLTHADVTRFFMTIPEAVQLVIQAGAMARGGEVFVLDMGEPVRIRDLAVKMIHLSGHTVRDEENPDGDIEIRVTGLRPGEKLYEELLIGGNALGTAHPRIMQADEAGLSPELLATALDELDSLLVGGRDEEIRHCLRCHVAGYAPAEVPRVAAAAPATAAVVLH